jgi:hypothetical protein
MTGLLTFIWPQPHRPWRESVSYARRREVPGVAATLAREELIHYRSGICDWNAGRADTRLLGLRFTDRISARVGHRTKDYRGHSST